MYVVLIIILWKWIVSFIFRTRYFKPFDCNFTSKRTFTQDLSASPSSCLSFRFLGYAYIISAQYSRHERTVHRSQRPGGFENVCLGKLNQIFSIWANEKVGPMFDVKSNKMNWRPLHPTVSLVVLWTSDLVGVIRLVSNIKLNISLPLSSNEL